MTGAIAFVVVWSLIGLSTAAIMARRGHNFWLYAPMGLAYGPLTAVIAWAASRRQPSDPAVVVPGSEWHRDGFLDVLIGLDGTDASVDAARSVLNRLGPAIRVVTLASVIDFEIADSLDTFATDDERLAHLASAADDLGVPNAELALLSGDVDTALTGHAERQGADLIVVGHRTRPLARRLRGSTLRALARRGSTPVIVVPSG